MTANSLDANPTIQAIAKTTNTISDFEPAGFIMFDDPLPTTTDADAISLSNIHSTALIHE